MSLKVITNAPATKLGRVDFTDLHCYETLVPQVHPDAAELGSRGGPRERSARVDVLLEEDDRVALLRAEARRGLTATPKQLPPKWFYDARGSELFDAITRQPEYYLTRREREILRARAGEIARLTGAATLIELGAGSADKTRLLLDALSEAGTLRCFMPFDVCLPAVQAAAVAIDAEYPDLEVRAVVGDFHQHVGFIPRDAGGRGARLVAFLGSTIGNFDADERVDFFRALRRTMRAGDFFLLGADLVKSKRRLDAAYDDAAGVTALFNKNVLRVLNRDLGASFDEARFDHVAGFDPERELVDIRLRARVAHTVPVRGLDLLVRFAAGEEMRTEISVKFTRPALEASLADAGFTAVRFWTDRARDFSLSLWTPSPRPRRRGRDPHLSRRERSAP
jgi:L-histidine N-alpha-methyltransferase